MTNKKWVITETKECTDERTDYTDRRINLHLPAALMRDNKSNN